MLVSLFFMACGGDDCAQADWLGTYALDKSTEMCEDENEELVDEFVVIAGSSENTINIDGEELTIAGCSSTITLYGVLFSFELDGNKLMVEGFGCSGTFTRQ